MPRLSSSSQVDNLSVEKAIDSHPTLEFPEIPREKNSIPFFGGKCTVRVANQLELRQKAYKNMYDLYAKMGIAEKNSNGLWVSIYDALPETTTLLAENEKGKIEGTLTLVFDSPIGLPADELYKKEVGEARNVGDQICEFISLGINQEGKSSIKALASLFYCGFLYAWHKNNSIVSIITIHSRYERFYCKNFSFEKMGPERNYAKANGAPTVLLNVAFKKLNRLRNKRRVFPFYLLKYSDLEEIKIFKKIEKLRRSMSDGEFVNLFIENTDTWEKASRYQKDFIKKVYPIEKANHYEVSRALARAFSNKNSHSDPADNDATKMVQW